jgi:hypothetical protein
MLAGCLNGNQTVAYLYSDGKVIQTVAVNTEAPSGFKKISIEEMIVNSVSHLLFPDEYGFFRVTPHDNWVKQKIKTAIDCHDIFNNNNPFDLLIQEIQTLPGTSDSIYQTLSTMCQKRQMKRTAQKTNGIWGFFLYIWNQIKFFVWDLFNNPSSQLNGLQKVCASLKSAVPVALQELPGVLKGRVELNIGGFLVEIGVEGEMCIESAKEINTKFLAKYHPDKYQYESDLSENKREFADRYLQRIIIIKKIWEQFEKGFSPSSNPAPATIRYLTV